MSINREIRASCKADKSALTIVPGIALASLEFQRRQGNMYCCGYAFACRSSRKTGIWRSVFFWYSA